MGQFIMDRDDEEIIRAANNIELITEETEITEEIIEHCKRHETVDSHVSKQNMEDWYCLLRNTQGDLSYYTRGFKYMEDNRGFLSDSLFCEYAYILNCDTKTLEFYRGFNTKKESKGRYAAGQDKWQAKDSGKYYGVALVAKIPWKSIRLMGIGTFVLILRYFAQQYDWERAPEYIEERDRIQLPSKMAASFAA